MCFYLQQADESLDFEEQILEAAKSIAAATSALVKSASAAQRELVAQGKVSQPTSTKDTGLLDKTANRQTDASVGFFVLQCQTQVGSNLANAVDDGQWSQGLISAVSVIAMCRTVLLTRLRDM